MIALFVVSSFFLICLIALDYYQNCAATDCAVVHASLAFFYELDFASVIPLINLLPIPLTLRLFVPSFILFSLMLISIFYLIFVRNGVKSALIACIELTLSVEILFEAGLYFLDPGWWSVHFSNLSSFPFSAITNENLAIAAGSLLLIVLGGRIFVSVIMGKQK